MNEKERDKLAAFIASLEGRKTFSEHEVTVIVLYLKILHVLARRLGGDWSAK